MVPQLESRPAAKAEPAHRTKCCSLRTHWQHLFPRSNPGLWGDSLPQGTEWVGVWFGVKPGFLSSPFPKSLCDPNISDISVTPKMEFRQDKECAILCLEQWHKKLYYTVVIVFWVTGWPMASHPSQSTDGTHAETPKLLWITQVSTASDLCLQPLIVLHCSPCSAHQPSGRFCCRITVEGGGTEDNQWQLQRNAKTSTLRTSLRLRSALDIELAGVNIFLF